MADIQTSTWSETAASNSSAAPDGAPEGMAPSGVNDTMREMMGAIKREWNRSHPTATTTGSVNAYALTYTTAPAAYVNGMMFGFRASSANTSTVATLNVNSLGAKNIKEADGSAIAVGAIATTQHVLVSYDATTDEFRRIGGGSAAAASETVSGIIEIATAAETTTGTDNTRAITPLKLTTFAPASATIDTANDKIIIFDATDSKLKQATFPTSTPNRNYAQTTSRSSLSANTIPNDGTIPQITEGTEILSTTITPSSVSARIRITAVVPCYIDGLNAVAALFIAGTNDALAVDYKFVTATGSPGVAAAFVIQFEHVPGSASSQTYSVRCGPVSGTLYINGNTSTQPYGAKQTASIVVQEVA